MIKTIHHVDCHKLSDLAIAASKNALELLKIKNQEITPETLGPLLADEIASANATVNLDTLALEHSRKG